MQLRLAGLLVLTSLLLVLVLIHLLLLLAGGPMGAPWYYLNFGLSWDGFSHGKIWQLLSYGLLHSDWLHLLVNLVVFWFAGGRVTRILGCRKCIHIIICGVLAGGLLHMLTGVISLENGYGESHLVGISGACMALLLTLTTLLPDSRIWLVPVSGKNLGLGFIIAELLLWLMHPGLSLPLFARLGEQMTAWCGVGLFQIGHACHLGGALAGWWLSRRLLAPIPSLKSLQRMRREREKEARRVR